MVVIWQSSNVTVFLITQKVGEKRWQRAARWCMLKMDEWNIFRNRAVHGSKYNKIQCFYETLKGDVGSLIS